MRITAKQLLRLPVVTEGGVTLGKVKDVMVQTDSFAITHVEVARAFSRSCFFVAVAQIVVIRADMVIVKDGVVEEKKEKSAIKIAPVYSRQ